MALALTAAASVSPSWHDSSSFLSPFSKKTVKEVWGEGRERRGGRQKRKMNEAGYTESQPGQFISVL